MRDSVSTQSYTHSLHDALPISVVESGKEDKRNFGKTRLGPQGFEHGESVHLRHHHVAQDEIGWIAARSEEHTSELQSPYDLVCRLLLEKKKKQRITLIAIHVRS